MAPRKLTKRVVESVATVDANGDSTPPKKRKIASAASKATAKESKQMKTKVRPAKVDKHRVNENETAADNTNLAKKPRGGKSAKKAISASPKAITATGMKSKSTKKVKKTEESAMNEGAGEQIVEKKTARTKSNVMAKKAGMKEQTSVKPKVKAPAKKRKNNTASENGAGEDAEKKEGKTIRQVPMRKTRAKAVEKEENVAQSVAAKVTKKRKNAVKSKDAIVEPEDMEVTEKEQEEEEETVTPEKKSRGKSKKTGVQTNDETEMKPKGRGRKNTTKAEVVKPSSLEEIETNEQNSQNIIIQKNDSKIMKNAKRANVKKTTSGRKLYTEVASATLPEEMECLKSREEIEPKQKKRNIKKINNTLTTEKIEAKNNQKKEQTAMINEVTSENSNTEINNILLTEKIEAINMQEKEQAAMINEVTSKDSITETNNILAIVKIESKNNQEKEQTYLENSITKTNSADKNENTLEEKEEIDKSRLPEFTKSMELDKVTFFDNEIIASIKKDEN